LFFLSKHENNARPIT